MKNECKDFILTLLWEKIKTGGNQRKRNIPLLLQTLNPGRPEDGSKGFLAYNVPNRDRMKIKTGKFLTRKLNLNHGYIPDSELQAIAYTINDYLFPEACLQLVNGSDITDNYRKEIGGRSCMTGIECRYTLLYEHNPDRFQQLIMEVGNDSSRAIIHKLDNGQFLMDRVYATCEYLKLKMFDYAKKQQWLYRESTLCEITTVYYNGTEIKDYDCLVVSNLEYENGEVPYMDTLVRYNLDNGLTISHSKSRHLCDGVLDSQEGRIGFSHSCDICECGMSEDDTYSINDLTLCEYCYSENYSGCDKCGDAVYNENVISIENGDYVCECCADNNYYQCSDCNTWHSDGLCPVDNEEKDVCSDCLETYYLCNSCEEYFTDVNSEGVCEACNGDRIQSGIKETGDLCV